MSIHHIHVRRGLLILLIQIMFVSHGFAQSSENYTLKKSVVDMGGGSASSASCQVKSAIGQPGVVGNMSSENYQEGSGFFAEPIEVTAVEEMENVILPKIFHLFQNYPNPFNPETTIEFHVKDPCQVTLTVYDMLGRELGALVNNQYIPGAYRVTFNASSLPSGIYIYRIRMGSYQSVKKMLLLE